MRAGLVGQEVGYDATTHDLRKNLGAVANQSDRESGLRSYGIVHPFEGFIQRCGHAIAIAGIDATPDARGIDLDAEKCRTVHGGRERLGSTHAAESAGQHEAACERPAEVPARRRRESLVSSLQDALAPDVDPAPGGHL